MEKYLVILIIVILFYLLYKYCIQIDNFGDTPITDAALLSSVQTLGTLATNLKTGLNILGDIVLQNRHMLRSTTTALELREKPSNDLASITVQNFDVVGYSNLVPRGTVVAWNFTAADVNAAGNLTPPSGWALCDGTTVGTYITPNLNNRFILGEGPIKKKGLTGGAETVSLNTKHLPSHRHNYELSTGMYTSGNDSKAFTSTRAGVWQHGALGGGNTGSTGTSPNGAPHENMPPFYVLVYIIRL